MADKSNSGESKIPRNPQELGAPHSIWRPNQIRMYESVLAIEDDGYIFISAPTGSGKSILPTVMGHRKNVLVVVHTLSLLDQYKAKYNFNIIKGKQEYPCVLESKVGRWKDRYKIEPTAADCNYSPMTKCAVAHKCPYILARNKALGSNRMACTYRYAAVSPTVQARAGDIVFDEAHDSAEELIRFNKFEISKNVIDRYELPKFPLSITWEGLLVEIIIKKISDWAAECLKILYVPDEAYDGIKNSNKKRLYGKFKAFFMAISDGDWFLTTSDTHVTIRALEASGVARRIFENKDKKILMSATIEPPAPLAKALGIYEYAFTSLPHPVPPSKRPVAVINAPTMSKRNIDESPWLYRYQASLIWNWIQGFPSHYRGAILTSSYAKIEKIYEHIKQQSEVSKKGIRIFPQLKGEKVGDVVQKFITDVKPGDIMIGTVQGMGSGIDLSYQLARWVVIAGVPHINPTDAYMKARRKKEGGIKYQRWMVYNSVMQACGRVSRGETNSDDFFQTNYALLADGSATTKTARKFYSPWFSASLKEVEIFDEE